MTGGAKKYPPPSSTAIIITYDDSDGWYDHQMGPIIRQSDDPTLDALNGPGKCGSSATPPAQEDRCGVGPRLPILVISPYARRNFVDSSFTEQASILKFIEDNWQLGRIGGGSADAGAGSLDGFFNFHTRRLSPAVIMNDNTGEVTKIIPTGGSRSGVGSGGGGGGYRVNLPQIRCGVSGRSATCRTGRAADRRARIALLLRQDGRLAVNRVGHLGSKIELPSRLQGNYSVAVDLGGTVEVVRNVRLR